VRLDKIGVTLFHAGRELNLGTNCALLHFSFSFIKQAIVPSPSSSLLSHFFFLLGPRARARARARTRTRTRMPVTSPSTNMSSHSYRPARPSAPRDPSMHAHMYEDHQDLSYEDDQYIDSPSQGYRKGKRQCGFGF